MSPAMKQVSRRTMLVVAAVQSAERGNSVAIVCAAEVEQLLIDMVVDQASSSPAIDGREVVFEGGGRITVGDPS